MAYSTLQSTTTTISHAIVHNLSQPSVSYTVKPKGAVAQNKLNSPCHPPKDAFHIQLHLYIWNEQATREKGMLLQIAKVSSKGGAVASSAQRKTYGNSL